MKWSRILSSPLPLSAAGGRKRISNAVHLNNPANDAKLMSNMLSLGFCEAKQNLKGT
jgi:hypothetical protein